MPILPWSTKRPTFSELVSQCREDIAKTAGQRVGSRLTDVELNLTPEQHYQQQKTQWIQKFKAAVVPGLHQDERYSQYFKRFAYTDAYAEKSYKQTFNRTAVDIAIMVYVSAEGKELSIEEWLGV
jgi:hypothetical protein